MTSIPVGAPIWADSLTTDLEADTRFYMRLFGWTSVDTGEDFGHYTTFGLPDGSSGPGRAVTGIMPCPPDMPPSQMWNLQFRVDDCDAATRRARELGGTVVSEPEDVGSLLRFSMVADPYGASFGLVEPKEPGSGFEAWGEPNSIGWVEYRYDGVPAEGMRFYTALLGWNVTTPPWENPSSPKPYAALSAAGSEREFGGCHASDAWELELPPAWNVMVQVDDAVAMCERAVELGGSVAAEPLEVPGLMIAGIAVPSGTVVGIQSPRGWE
ncbi:VOC family protein [Glycomyces sp. TRM65418]|uniref:VOC family protein n=1 Tax=Glycomyces sp. TRM65418 TaxID=2867006 RepID=UPI001CE4F6D2|nr:VOC family protein [Glycomyces sp. TRM65418]MCC3765764.1 VOC family protein [Glycomyces sp. TRM65418]QZD55354.1 VOC family protein [Glycomyces sp. TRM65418]